MVPGQGQLFPEPLQNGSAARSSSTEPPHIPMRRGATAGWMRPPFTWTMPGIVHLAARRVEGTASAGPRSSCHGHEKRRWSARQQEAQPAHPAALLLLRNRSWRQASTRR